MGDHPGEDEYKEGYKKVVARRKADDTIYGACLQPHILSVRPS